MEKVPPWSGQPSDRGWLKIRSEQICTELYRQQFVSGAYVKLAHRILLSYREAVRAPVMKYNQCELI